MESIHVVLFHARKEPIFLGSAGPVHDEVPRGIAAVLASEGERPDLDEIGAPGRSSSARRAARESGAARRGLIGLGDGAARL